MASFLSSTNISLYTIPVGWIIGMMPHIYAVKTYEGATKKGMDRRNPRGFTEQVTNDQALDSTYVQPLP